ncbi:MAG: LysR family transcriptional regulator [Pseudomonadales bacterium]|nr:LysR family transcriptional regulator [Pseudomonadales bacterium]
MRITLKQLSVFAAIAKHENISQAADEAALTQSAMSMSLKELESQLGSPLFHRHGKRLKLNNTGLALQPRVQQLLQLAEEIERLALQDELSGVLRIGASSTIGNYLVPAIIAEFLEANPDVHIDLKVANTQQIVDDMKHLRIDIGLIEGLTDAPQLDKKIWRHDELKIFAASNHALSTQKQITFAQLAQTPWILREQGSGTRDIFTHATHDKFEPQAQLLELGNSEAIKQAVKTGFGISCLSVLAINAELKHQELKVLDVRGLDLSRKLYIIKHKAQISSRIELAFEEKLISG